MLKVDGKEVVFSKTLILSKGETAVVRPQELMGLGVQFEAKTDPADHQWSSRRIDDTTVGVFFPFIAGPSLQFDVPELAKWQGGTFKLRFLGQPVQDVMLVHIDIYLERAANYGPR